MRCGWRTLAIPRKNTLSNLHLSHFSQWIYLGLSKTTKKDRYFRISSAILMFTLFFSSQMKLRIKSHWDSNIGESKQWKPMWTKVKNRWFWTQSNKVKVWKTLYLAASSYPSSILLLFLYHHLLLQNSIQYTQKENKCRLYLNDAIRQAMHESFYIMATLHPSISRSLQPYSILLSAQIIV